MTMVGERKIRFRSDKSETPTTDVVAGKKSSGPSFFADMLNVFCYVPDELGETAASRNPSYDSRASQRGDRQPAESQEAYDFEQTMEYVALPEKLLAEGVNKCTAPSLKDVDDSDDYDEEDAPIIAQPGKEEAKVGKWRDFVAFPANNSPNIAYPSKRTGKKTSASRSSTAEESIFEKVMDRVAFPEEHLSIPSMNNFVDEESQRRFSRALTPEKGSTFEKTMDYVAFPEKNVSCSSMSNVAFPENSMSCPSMNNFIGGESQRRLSKALTPEKGSTFEKTMDYVAFPEKHVPCSSMSNVAFPENNVSCSSINNFIGDEAQTRVSRSLASEEGSTFEKTMDYVAFPEKHVSCGAQSGAVALDTMMDCVTFPEKHMAFPQISDARSCKSSLRAVNRSIQARSNKDIIDDVFDNAEAQCCVDRSKGMNQALAKESDLLDYVFTNVEAAICRDSDDISFEDLRAIEDNRTSKRANVYIQRDSSLIDSNNLPLRGDVLISNEEEKYMCESAGRDIVAAERAASRALQNCYEDVRNCVEDELCHPDSFHPGTPEEMTPPCQLSYLYEDFSSYGVRRDRSLLSESSISTVSMDARADPRNGARNEGMELVLHPKRPKKNTLSKFVGGFDGPKVASSKKKRSANTSKSKKASF